MKSALTALILLTFALGRGEAAAASICVDVQMVSLSPAAALELVPRLRRSSTALAAWERLQQMLASGEATLLGWPLLHLVEGASVATAAGAEIRFPDEFTPPSRVGFSRLPPILPILDTTPTSWDVRLQGAALKVKGAHYHSGLVTLELEPSYGRLLAMHTISSNVPPLGMELQMQQPEFLCLRSTTSLTVAESQPALLSSFIVAKPQPQAVLFLIRAHATSLPSGLLFPSSK